MSALLLFAGTTVAQALDGSADLGGVFIAHRTACVGCYMARFCTLADVAGVYGLAQEAFIEELNRAASFPTLTRGGENA